MKIFVRIVQVLVGVLFIVSGIVKANDPLGLSYKMQEFFELWNSELAAGGFFLKNALISMFEFLHDQSLALSVFMITLEIVAGVALLLGWMKNFILWLLLLLIVFFTFLTGYAYLSGKFTNCGCFGDCLPITPFASFLKDIVLVVLILILLFGKRYIVPLLSKPSAALTSVFSLLGTLLLQWYVLNYLPLVDCLPFKKGNNIVLKMQPPPGSVPDSFAIRFVYEKGGKQFEFSPEELPADFDTYKFIDRKDKLIRKGNAEPPIKGFSLTGVTGTDSTQIILAEPVVVLLFAQHLQSTQWMKQLSNVVAAAKAKNIPVYLATPSITDARPAVERYGLHGVELFNCDFTVVRTAARTDPTIYILKEGVVANKYSKHGFKAVVQDLSKL